MARNRYQIFDSDGESWFPKSVETVSSWDLPETAKRRPFWNNAVKFYARYS